MLKNQYSAFDPNSTAQSLLDRGSFLTDCAAREDASATVMVLARTVATPIALLAIFDPERELAIEAMLSDIDFDVEKAPGITYVLEHAPRRRRYYVVITDSIGLLRALHLRDSTHLRYVVLLTQPGHAAEEEGYEAGASDCIPRDSPDISLRTRLATARRVQELQASLQAAVAQGREYSVLDELTRVASRRFFARHFPLEIVRARKLAKPLSLIACDIDHFKRINDSFGHPVGDEVLREFTARLRGSTLPQAGWMARLGGEEFGIVLPDTSYDGARVIALKMRRLIAERPFSDGAGDIDVTASFGVCSVNEISTAAATSLSDDMVKAADAALYRSKSGGRNRVTGTLLRTCDLTAPLAGERQGTSLGHDADP
jgi:diguanylate cyclase (GGDEF)-like protein